ncbi:hypothetical protein DXG01_007854, partial [Tephrocybe rancida]
MPRCDLLAWILVVKLAPTYYRKLNRLLTETGRYRELPSWRKGFKREWKKLAKTPISMPLNGAYRPDPKRMVCTCPYLATSRFLLCKHLVQAHRPVPPVFFLEVKRERTALIWRHTLLKPLDDGGDTTAEHPVDIGTARDNDCGPFDDEDEDEDDDLVDTGSSIENQTFEEAMRQKIRTIKDIAEGLEYQIQFRDHRMLEALEREGSSFFRMVVACLSEERRMQSTRGGVPSTWEQSTSIAMFYCSRGRSMF